MSLDENGMESFQYTALPARVVFGFGTLEKVAGELGSLGRNRAFVLSDPHHATAAAARLMRVLGDFAVHLSTDAVMHTPVEITERVSGGSTIGLAKALALRTDLPQIVLPTTYAGSEATPVLGETREGQKSTIRSMKVLPEVIVYDVELTYGSRRRYRWFPGSTRSPMQWRRSTQRMPIPSRRALRSRASQPSDVRCLGLFQTRPTEALARMRCLEPGSVEHASER
jgi:hypothetical protein